MSRGAQLHLLVVQKSSRCSYRLLKWCWGFKSSVHGSLGVSLPGRPLRQVPQKTVFAMEKDPVKHCTSHSEIHKP